MKAILDGQLELWLLKRFSRVPWTARKLNQSIRKDINLEYSLEGTDAKAEAPILWPPDAKSWLTEKNKNKKPWCWERLRAGGEEGNRGWDGWMVSWKQLTGVWANSRRWRRTGKPWLVAVQGAAKSSVWLNDWTSVNQLDIHLSL